jgi:SAM-dependent methyltransferase
MSPTSVLEFLQAVRRQEIERLLPWFPPATRDGIRTRVLDLGAGTGDQARYLAGLGYEVTALEVSSSAYRADRVHPIVEYDGHVLPVADRAIDLVFSSNVLEHVPHVDEMLVELARVHAPGARSVHVLPTSAWRFWTTLSHYAWLAKRLLGVGRSPAPAGSSDAVETRGVLARLWADAVPHRHGERGSTLTELHYFSRRWWEARFRRHGYDVVAAFPVGLFYTGATVFGLGLSLSTRRRLAPWLGSACRVYVLERSSDRPSPPILGAGPSTE